tara:strand:- start:15 stop:152 length:138 start_codon:yes stop_codon:yes gene_type:complete
LFVALKLLIVDGSGAISGVLIGVILAGWSTGIVLSHTFAPGIIIP